jgi:adenylate kinase family enzyme
MPWLTSTDELPRHPCRVLIAGSTGAGKSTLARAVARQLKIDYFEIDALYHGPDWIPQPSFESSVDARIATSAWVTEWQYSSVQSRLADRADLMVWLDLPRQTVMRSVIRRTIRRSLSGAQLWNGNQEPALRTILTDHDHIIRWAWRTHHPRREQIRACLQARPHLDAVALRCREDAATWLTGPLARAATRT